ncbi:MAG: acyl-homoserine-lactone synthase [Pseudomonadota bacterium]
MQATALSFNNFHLHGELFKNVLRARHESFIVERRWDLPQTDGMEFDQYDTPESKWIAVHEGGQVLGGFRLTPTTAKCGIYSYMIRDAQRGILGGEIPQDLLYDDAPVIPHFYEFSRFFKSSHLNRRAKFMVQKKLYEALLECRDTFGARSLIGIGSPGWGRWLKHLGMELEFLGPEIMIEGVLNRVSVTHLPGSYH